MVILLFVYSFNVSHFFIYSIVFFDIFFLFYLWIYDQYYMSTFITIPAASSFIFPITFLFLSKKNALFFG